MAASRPAPARQRSLREHNLALVLAELADRGPASRAALAARTGLTKATVSRLVDALIEGGLAVEPAPDPPDGAGSPEGAGRPRDVPGRVGRPATPVAVSPDGPMGVGLEINVDYLISCVVDLTGAVRHRELVASDLRRSDPSAAIDLAAGLARRAVGVALAEGGGPAGVSVAVPGLVGPAAAGDAPVLRLAPNLGWREVDVLGELRARAGLDGMRMSLENEANAGALGELWGGGHRVGGRSLRSFVHVSGEIGVGAGVVVDGVLYRGARGFGGELGHLPVQPDGPVCACGGSGCLERLAGQEAILRAAGLALVPSTVIGRPAGSVAELVARAGAGEPSALSAIAGAGEWLGVGVAAMVNLWDLDTVILGGLYAALAPWMRAEVEARLARQVLSAGLAPVRVLVGALAGEAAVRGAALSMVREVIARPAAWADARGAGEAGGS